MYYFSRFLPLLCIHSTLFASYSMSESTTPKTEEALFEIANQICLEKTGYQPLENNAYFKVEETPVNGNVTLPCAYCGEKGEDIPRIWFWKKREFGAEEKELEMGLAPNLTENRIFTLPDNSLTIQQVTTNDSGLYYCRSLVEGEFSQFHFSLDVVQAEVAISEKNKKGASDESVFLEYIEKVITKANEKIASDENIGKDFDKVIIKITSEWDPWLPCDGCLGIRKRYAKCRIRPKLNKAAFPDLTEERLEDPQRLLLGSTVLSCHSLDLARWFPTLYSFSSSLPNHLRVQPCQDACLRENRMLHEARYRLDFIMDVQSSMSFICPDADLRTKVVWRKDGSIVKPIGAPKKPVKRKKIKLPFEKKTNEYDFKHAFVDRMNVLQLCYVGYKETGVYTCYIDNKPIKAFNITVVTPEETLKERHYHFVLVTVYTCTLSGAIVVMGITWAVLQRDELFQKRESMTERRLSIQSTQSKSKYLRMDLKERKLGQVQTIQEED